MDSIAVDLLLSGSEVDVLIAAVVKLTADPIDNIALTTRVWFVVAASQEKMNIIAPRSTRGEIACGFGGSGPDLRVRELFGWYGG